MFIAVPKFLNFTAMNIPNLSKSILCLTAVASLFLSSCSKTEDTMENDAACEYYLAGLSFQCGTDSCEYTATLEHDATGVKSEVAIDEATFNHYKTIAEVDKANICWEGAL
ncbi:hypothetical protein [Robertkochia sediminum]|uniref:hypothetical protein n=1 Tax=Robertkochia sediminum TaxID=2785326 RepID=UPI001931C210|nr:hypothetical protein [Robertkochia sediminum]MBL7471513.1 hypothetical protein [Robertkochia sediminum]